MKPEEKIDMRDLNQIEKWNDDTHDLVITARNACNDLLSQLQIIRSSILKTQIREMEERRGETK